MLVSGIFIGLQESWSLAEMSQGLFWGESSGEPTAGHYYWKAFHREHSLRKELKRKHTAKFPCAKRSRGKIGKVA